MHQNVVQFESTKKIVPFSWVIFMCCLTLNIKCLYVTMAEVLHRSHLSAKYCNIVANVFVAVDTITLYCLPLLCLCSAAVHCSVWCYNYLLWSSSADPL